MTTVFWLLIALMLLALVAGLSRVALGPTPSDRMLAAQLIATSGVALLLLFASASAQPALVDVALAFALLAAVAGVAFVRRFDLGRAEKSP